MRDEFMSRSRLRGPGWLTHVVRSPHNIPRRAGLPRAVHRPVRRPYGLILIAVKRDCARAQTAGLPRAPRIDPLRSRQFGYAWRAQAPTDVIDMLASCAGSDLQPHSGGRRLKDQSPFCHAVPASSRNGASIFRRKPHESAKRAWLIQPCTLASNSANEISPARYDS